MLNVIRCDLTEYIVWKWRPQFDEDGQDPHKMNKNVGQRSNHIRWGSSLRVKDGEMAVFVYRGSSTDGHDNQDFIMGPFDGTIHTANLPVISKLIGLAYGGGDGGPFQAEVYFINLQGNNQVMFGIPFTDFKVFDSRYPDLAIPAATRGTITFNLTDYKAFIKLNRLTDFNMMDFKKQIRSALVKYLKHVIINTAREENISVMQLESRLIDLSDAAQRYVAKRFVEDFGVNLKALDIEAITLDEQSENYKQLKGLTFGIASRTTRAQADANIQNLEDMQRYNSENVQKTMEIQREEMQRAQRLETETNYLGAHSLDRQADVASTFASAMGESGAMNVGGGGQMNPAGMMTGMMMGGAMGQQMAGMMNQMGQTVNQSYQQAQQTPPQVPQMDFYVLIGGQQSGPHSVAQLRQLIASGQLTPDTYVWKAGMANWDFAKNTDVNSLFPVAPPPPPIPPTPPTPPVPPMNNQ